MTERWKAWKTKSRFSTLPSAPWKSRKGGEISTFPQVLLPLPSRQKNRGRRKNSGPWKSGNPKAGFPLSHSPESCLRRKEEGHQKTTQKGAVLRSLPITRFMLILYWNRSRFHAHPWIGKCLWGRLVTCGGLVIRLVS